MAPEQKVRGARLGPWTDVYLLGRTLAAFLDPVKALRDTGPNSVAIVSRKGLAAIKAALADRPEGRPKTAAEFGQLLFEAAGAAA
jgi:hypothetical protein